MPPRGVARMLQCFGAMLFLTLFSFCSTLSGERFISFFLFFSIFRPINQSTGQLSKCFCSKHSGLHIGERKAPPMRGGFEPAYSTRPLPICLGNQRLPPRVACCSCVRCRPPRCCPLFVLAEMSFCQALLPSTADQKAGHPPVSNEKCPLAIHAIVASSKQKQA